MILATIGLTLFRLRPLINLLTLIATGLYILASMTYQLAIAKQQIIEKNVFSRNCSQVRGEGLEKAYPIDLSFAPRSCRMSPSIPI